MEKELICLSCPIGCRLTVREDNGELQVTGNRCPKGVEYAREEYYAPKRVVTATCRSLSPLSPRVPVRSTKPVPVEKIDEMLRQIYSLELSPPMEAGAPVIRDFDDTDIDVVLSTDLQ